MTGTRDCPGAPCAGVQKGDGSWPYGTAQNDGFVDFYHSGFVLRALADIGEHVALGS
ncbi:MAG: hypothetical protein R3B97_12245 [Dehalococcoidia bacterium]